MASTAQVDSAVPRAKAVFHFVLPAVAFLVGPPAAQWILLVTGLIMGLSVIGGPRYSLFGHLFKAVRPSLGIGPGRKDAVAPHRFAEALGAVCLLAAAILYFAGATLAGQVLALMVAVLALLNAAAGICVGCQMYLLFKRFSRGATV
ncbi:MAG TPA: DUF4395 domain-containing protein [Actinomycetota bacterium]|nr:DUF4395 domain-containing protein [Actinomycetota bacterium]